MTGLTPRSANHHFGPGRFADHWLYRCYDADGRLLYVGCTADVKKRIAAHRRGDGRSRASAWLSACMAEYVIEGPIQGREAARKVEASAIWNECPLFNVQESRTAYLTHIRVANYLLEHGHIELAAETACRCRQAEPDAGLPAVTCRAHLALQAGAA